MKVKVKILADQVEEREIEVLQSDMTYEELLEKLKINSEEVIVLRNGEPVPNDEKVEDGEITILRVVSMG
jgi:sulfur carrier protein